MRKFFKSLFACFIILAIFGAFVFFLGWTQIRVSPDKVGVLKSKTGGVYKDPVYSGKFSWHWEFLLPTNAEFQTYDLKPYYIKSKVKGALPSGEVYSSYSDEKINFNYEFDFDFNVSVKPESIVSLTSDVIVSGQESLDKYVKDSCDSISKAIASEIVKKAHENSAFYPSTLSSEELISMIDAGKLNRYLELNNVSLTYVSFPDIALYNKVRESYLSKLPDEKTKKVNTGSSSEEQANDFLGKLRLLLDDKKD